MLSPCFYCPLIEVLVLHLDPKLHLACAGKVVIVLSQIGKIQKIPSDFKGFEKSSGARYGGFSKPERTKVREGFEKLPNAASGDFFGSWF